MSNLELFQKATSKEKYRPLADLLRPNKLSDLEGVSKTHPELYKLLQTGEGLPPSMILWGPPGCGKTTLAKLVGKLFDCSFRELSAVLSGVKDIKTVVAEAKIKNKPTVLFVDEIHRFNKSQQDAFLPHIEAGTIVLLGATTENPSFYLNSALLSRAKVVILKSLESESLNNIIIRAENYLKLKFDENSKKFLCEFGGGDARLMLNTIEQLRKLRPEKNQFTKEEVLKILEQNKTLFYDLDEHYHMISAFIKSMRGSDPDAALFWGFRMLESGEDPRYLIRRMIIFASEDVGNADPRALTLATSTLAAFNALGLPEGRIPIAQCITYLATAPKSNRSYAAMHKALSVLKENTKVSVPKHLKNSVTSLDKKQGYGENYKYPHSYEGAFVKGENYFPEEVEPQRFYELSDVGYEKKLKEFIKSK